MSETGIAGLTLGGGGGVLVLMRAHGLSCDNLGSIEITTADAQSVRPASGSTRTCSGDSSRYFFKSHFLDALTDQAIDAMIDCDAHRPNPESLPTASVGKHLDRAFGAGCRLDGDETGSAVAVWCAQRLMRRRVVRVAK